LRVDFLASSGDVEFFIGELPNSSHAAMLRSEAYEASKETFS
jgi:hypothetical protein